MCWKLHRNYNCDLFLKKSSCLMLLTKQCMQKLSIWGLCRICPFVLFSVCCWLSRGKMCKFRLCVILCLNSFKNLDACSVAVIICDLVPAVSELPSPPLFVAGVSGRWAQCLVLWMRRKPRTHVPQGVQVSKNPRQWKKNCPGKIGWKFHQCLEWVCRLGSVTLS